jgi:hypothetical protein
MKLLSILSRIVKTAAAEFRRNGIHATGLSDLMAADIGAVSGPKYGPRSI